MTIPPGMTGNIEALSEKYGKAPFFLGWHEIRHLLYESLPAGVVEFDKQVCHAMTQCALQMQTARDLHTMRPYSVFATLT